MRPADHYLILSAFYFAMVFPAGWLIGAIIKNQLTQLPRASSGIAKAGWLIGVLERIIVFTFVLRGQYEAIGLLIAAKSILRFRDHDADLQTEYVLVGTLCSLLFALAAGEIYKVAFGR